VGRRDGMGERLHLRIERATRRRGQRHPGPQCRDKSAAGAETMNANPADVASIDAIVRAAYDVISGPAGPRDWERERSLFWPGARLIPTARDAGAVEVQLTPNMLDVDGLIARAEKHFSEHPFYERQIARRVEEFGRIAHVWSTYESRH